MARKPNSFHFDIPIPVIIVALIFSFPIGVILAVLRIVSSVDGEEKIRKAAQTAESTLKNMANKTFSEAESEAAAPSKKRNKGKNKVKRSAGAVISGILSVVFLILGALGMVFLFDDGIQYILENFLEYVAPFMTLSGISYLFHVFFRERDGRFNRIRAVIGEKDSYCLSKIAAVSKQSLKKVRKDVQAMIDKGEFGDEAFIDLRTDCFMRYADAAPDVAEGIDYRSFYDERIFGKDKEQKSTESDVKGTTGKDDAPSDKAHFRSIILEIRRLNDEIHDFAVSERIYRIEEYTQNIFDYVTDHPEAMPRIRTFMNYYLPTTLKLLESYRRIEHMGVAGDNMKTSKEKIENILDLLVEGYKQQMDNLFQNESIDISSDISVLETMMQKDGLSGNKTFFRGEDTDLGASAAQRAPDGE